MRTNNKKAINRMKDLIKEHMDMSDIIRYYSAFNRVEYDFNVFTYGNLDCYDYDLFKRLKEFGIDTKAVTEYEKVLNGGCTYKHREAIRNTYKRLVHNAVLEIIKEG